MIAEQQVEAYLRIQCGDPDADAVSRRTLMIYFASALEWLAAELDLNVRTVNNLYALTASDYDYPLPQDTYEIIWVEWNEQRLTRQTMLGWNRDGVDYRNAEAGTPADWAVIGNELILYPPPSSDAITTDGYLDMCWISGGVELGPNGVPGFTNLDTWVCIYKAAQQYCDMHPSKENQVRSAANAKEWASRLPLCIRHHQERGASPAAKVQVWSSRSR